MDPSTDITTTGSVHAIPDRTEAIVIGGGPAGLMAAEQLTAAGCETHVFDAMPSVGRKLLLAGKGGLNLTHSEPFERFAERYGTRHRELEALLRGFDADALRRWTAELGIETFVGSSGRVFPVDLKAAPLLRAWLHRLRASGVQLHARHRLAGLDADGGWRFETPHGPRSVQARVVVLALGGASWPQLGSDGAWWPLLRQAGVDLAPLRPSNCGFDVTGWSPHLRRRFAGAPIKPVVLRAGPADAPWFARRGEFVLTETGIEGSLVYAASALLRDAIEAHGDATVTLDLLPDHAPETVAAEVARPRGPRSLSTHLKSRLGIDGVKATLLHEVLDKPALADPVAVAAALKALPLRLVATRPIAEAISSAGGVRFEALDDGLMLRQLPGVFCAGEMLDWEAPTGGYLLNACFASGRAAGAAAAAWLRRGS